jgi:hypothetical protein
MAPMLQSGVHTMPDSRFIGMLTLPIFLIVVGVISWSVWYAVSDEELS